MPSHLFSHSLNICSLSTCYVPDTVQMPEYGSEQNETKQNKQSKVFFSCMYRKGETVKEISKCMVYYFSHDIAKHPAKTPS